MSSLAMYLTARGHSINPGQLNDWLKGHGGGCGPEDGSRTPPDHVHPSALNPPSGPQSPPFSSTAPGTCPPGYADGDLLVWSAVDSTYGVSYQGQERPSIDAMVSGLGSCHGLIANVRGGTQFVFTPLFLDGV